MWKQNAAGQNFIATFLAICQEHILGTNCVWQKNRREKCEKSSRVLNQMTESVSPTSSGMAVSHLFYKLKRESAKVQLAFASFKFIQGLCKPGEGLACCLNTSSCDLVAWGTGEALNSLNSCRVSQTSPSSLPLLSKGPSWHLRLQSGRYLCKHTVYFYMFCTILRSWSGGWGVLKKSDI